MGEHIVNPAPGCLQIVAETEMADRTERMHAALLGERLDTRGLGRGEIPTLSPLMMPIGTDGCAFLFRFGAVVFADVSTGEQAAVIARLAPRIGEPLATPERDEVRLRIEPGADERVDADGTVVLCAASPERRMIVADILAKSLVLLHYEAYLGEAFDRVEPLAESLQQGRPGARGKALLRHIGSVLRTQHKMVGRVEITEKPEVLWDHPDLERLFARLQDEYDLKERAHAVERKLEVISRTAEIALDLDHQRRSLRVEWSIVALIVLEIALGLYDRLSG